jgi:large subunit ribosomal protein L29
LKATEIRNMTPDEIEQKILSLKEQMFNLRVEFSSGRAERPHRLGEIRRDIARCYTILEEKKNEK